MSSASPRWVPVAGLGALVLLNVVLIALLMVRPSSPTVAEQEAPPASPSASQPGDEEVPLSKGEPAELTTSEEESEGLAPAQRLLVNADAATAWRATVGDCTDQGTLERTVDAGETWEELPLDLAPVSRMRVLGTQSLFVIGGGEDCEPTYLSSSTAGASWATNDQFLVGSWFVVPGDRDLLGTPVGEVEAPCVVTELAALDASKAAALCSDSSLVLTDDGGASWAETVPVVDAIAIGVADSGYALAGAFEGCGDDVAVVVTDSAGDAAAEPACMEAGVNDAELAVSALMGAVWLWSGDDVLVSRLASA